MTSGRRRADDGVVRPRSRTRRLLATAVLVLALVLAAGTPVAAQRGGDGSAPTTEDTAVPVPRMIPLPNTGTKPTDAGDRGGALQILVFVALVAGVGGITALAVRDARRSRRRAAERQSSGP